MSELVQLNVEVIKGRIKELVRGSVPQCILGHTSLQGEAGSQMLKAIHAHESKKAT